MNLAQLSNEREIERERERVCVRENRNHLNGLFYCCYCTLGVYELPFGKRVCSRVCIDTIKVTPMILKQANFQIVLENTHESNHLEEPKISQNASKNIITI